jgi:hypothetical protein
MVYAELHTGYQPGRRMDFDGARRSVLAVGSGRGFVVESKSGRLIITAANCLPFFPPSDAATLLEERTFQNVIGPLGGRQTIWGECVFADRAADIAVLGPPDSQEFEGKYDAHRAFVDTVGSLTVSNPSRRSAGHFLSLDGRWLSCDVRHQNGPLSLLAQEEISPAVAGSPILDWEGTAIGVLAAPGRSRSDGRTESGPNPHLVHILPEWLVSMMKPRFAAR